jgi:hypothetical protein
MPIFTGRAVTWASAASGALSATTAAMTATVSRMTFARFNTSLRSPESSTIGRSPCGERQA